MIRKYFPFDKNYLLEQAQVSQENPLIFWLIDQAKAYYLRENNPLGIMDDTAIHIQQHVSQHDDRLTQFYTDLSGVYRYRYGENQLELLFDGADHRTKYCNEWERTYKSWILDLLQSPYFLRTILEITVFNDNAARVSRAQIRLRSYIEKCFNLRLYHYHGIKAMHVA